MKNSLASFVVGFIFSLGLGISGMTQPQKVIGFLDIFGNWDPSLIFVMVGAISIHFITYKWIRSRKTPVLSSNWHVPTKVNLTPSLIGGSFIFGIGWAIAGFCPGPAVTSLASLKQEPFVFVTSMLMGMFLFNFFDRRIHFKR